MIYFGFFFLSDGMLKRINRSFWSDILNYSIIILFKSLRLIRETKKCLILWARWEISWDLALRLPRLLYILLLTSFSLNINILTNTFFLEQCILYLIHLMTLIVQHCLKYLIIISILLLTHTKERKSVLHSLLFMDNGSGSWTPSEVHGINLVSNYTK